MSLTDFDPEDVGRWDEDGSGGEVVDSQDYDRLLALYRSAHRDGWGLGYAAAIEDWDEKGGFAIPQIPENG
jgi:hypothetical protein